MSNLSNIIEKFINQLIEEAKGTIEIQRNELANVFNCSPSQINYVLMTRFTSDRGYSIESRRGGGGCIRISKISIDKSEYLLRILSERIGSSVNKEKAFEFVDILLKQNLIDEKVNKLIKAAVDDNTLSKIPKPVRDVLRADILKASVIAALLN